MSNTFDVGVLELRRVQRWSLVGQRQAVHRRRCIDDATQRKNQNTITPHQHVFGRKPGSPHQIVPPQGTLSLKSPTSTTVQLENNGFPYAGNPWKHIIKFKLIGSIPTCLGTVLS